MKYQPPFGPNWPNVSNPNAPYVNGNPPEGIKGSVPPASSFEFPMREIVHMIEKGGYVPADPLIEDPAHGSANPDDPNLFQLTQGARRALYSWGIDTGSANSLSVALDPPLKAYGQGLEIRVLIAADNTGSSTIRVNGLATQQIVKKDGSQLFAGELRRGGIAVLVHDGTYFQLVSGAAGSTTISDGWFNGADWVIDVGTPSVIVGTPVIAPTALAAGQGYAIYVKNRNTGATTVNLNNLGAKPLLLPTGGPLARGDIMPNMVIYVRYDGASFIMLSPIDRAIIQAPATFIVGPNPTPTPDFPDLPNAMEWMGRRKIGVNGTVDFKLQGQTTGTPVVHTINAMLHVAHPDGDRITIEGWGMNFIPSRGSFTCHGADAGSRASDAAANLAMMRSAFQTEIRFPSSPGIQFDGTRLNFKNLLITGSGMTVSNYNGFMAVNCSTININTVGVAYFSTCFEGWNATTIVGVNVYAIGAGLCGWSLADATSISIGSTPGVGLGGTFVVMQCGSMGIQAGNQAQIDIQVDQDQPAIYGCAAGGVYLYGSSSFNSNNLLIIYAGGIGVQVTSGATFRGNAGNISNASQGFNVSVGSDANVPNWMTANCASGDFTAAFNSSIYAAGYQNGSAQFTPTKNTNGNANSYIVA